jgi:hypothetical protein
MGMIANDFSVTTNIYNAVPEDSAKAKQSRERHRLEVRRRIEELMEQKRLEGQIHDDFDTTMDYLDY